YVLGVASHLFENPEDPRSAHHPAVALLRNRWEGRPTPRNQLARAVSVCDYWLACVRFAAGVPRCEDIFYTQPQQIPEKPTVKDRGELASRVARAARALAFAMRLAVEFDRAWECSHRQKLIRGRVRRLAELAQFAGIA